MKIGEVCGTENLRYSEPSENRLLKSISSRGNTMLIDFKKQFMYGKVEFEAKILYSKLDTDCDSWLNPNNNVLMSPIYPNKFNKPIYCTWLITKSFGSYIILDMDYIEVSVFNEPFIETRQFFTQNIILIPYITASKWTSYLKSI